MTQPIVIVGAGGFGREVLDVVEALSPVWDFVGFVDDGEVDAAVVERRGALLIGAVDELQHRDAAVSIGIGSGTVRARVDRLVTGWGRESAVLVHPSASIGGDVELGPGAVITAGARLTTNIRAGRHLHVNLNATIGHDCVVGDYVTINPGANISGSVRLGDGVMVGTGAAIIQGVTVGAGTVIGAGAVVNRDLPAGVTAVGVPARPIGREPS